MASGNFLALPRHRSIMDPEAVIGCGPAADRCSRCLLLRRRVSLFDGKGAASDCGMTRCVAWRPAWLLAISILVVPVAQAHARAQSAEEASNRVGAERATGRWDREDGRGGIEIARCGNALCGRIVWLKEPSGPGRVGETVLFDMVPTASETWSGRAHNPEDGQDYAGSMTLAGNRLFTRGCIFGGMICKSVALVRAR